MRDLPEFKKIIINDIEVDTFVFLWDGETCDCGCHHEVVSATTVKEGVPLCDDCTTTVECDDYGLVCGKETNGFTICHQCGETIQWGPVLTEQWQANYRIGSCLCGESWREEDKGGWGHYSYDYRDPVLILAIPNENKCEDCWVDLHNYMIEHSIDEHRGRGLYPAQFVKRECPHGASKCAPSILLEVEEE